MINHVGASFGSRCSSSQAIMVAGGVQQKFDWKSVAVAGVTAGITNKMLAAFNNQPLAGYSGNTEKGVLPSYDMSNTGNVARVVTAELVNEAIRANVYGSRFQFSNVAQNSVMTAATRGALGRYDYATKTNPVKPASAPAPTRAEQDVDQAMTAQSKAIQQRLENERVAMGQDIIDSASAPTFAIESDLEAPELKALLDNFPNQIDINDKNYLNQMKIGTHLPEEQIKSEVTQHALASGLLVKNGKVTQDPAYAQYVGLDQKQVDATVVSLRKDKRIDVSEVADQLNQQSMSMDESKRTAFIAGQLDEKIYKPLAISIVGTQQDLVLVNAQIKQLGTMTAGDKTGLTNNLLSQKRQLMQTDAALTQGDFVFSTKTKEEYTHIKQNGITYAHQDGKYNNIPGASNDAENSKIVVFAPYLGKDFTQRDRVGTIIHEATHATTRNTVIQVQERHTIQMQERDKIPKMDDQIRASENIPSLRAKAFVRRYVAE